MKITCLRRNLFAATALAVVAGLAFSTGSLARDDADSRPTTGAISTSSTSPATTSQAATTQSEDVKPEKLEVTVLDAKTEKPIADLIRVSLLHDRRPILTENASEGIIVFAVEPKEGMSLKCLMAVDGKGLEFRRDISAQEVKLGRVKWLLPLDRTNRQVNVRVVDKATDQPVPGAWVATLDQDSREINGCKTDADGKATLPLGVESRCEIKCDRVFLQKTWVNVSHPPKVAVSDKDLQAGQVVLRIETPNISMVVNVVLHGQTRKSLTVRDGTVRCSSDSKIRDWYTYGVQADGGIFLFADLADGEYSLRMVDPKNPAHYVTRSPQTVLIKKGQTKRVTLVVEDAENYRGTLAGVVSGPNGPISGARVCLKGDTSDSDQNTTTSDSGVFVFGNVLAGTHFFRVEKTGYKTTEFRADTPCQKLSIKLERSLKLTLRIKGISGKVAGATCCALFMDEWGHVRERGATVSNEGVADIQGIYPGPSLVWVRLQDRSEGGVDLVQLDDDATKNISLSRLAGASLFFKGKPGETHKLLLINKTKPEMAVETVEATKQCSTKLLGGRYDIYVEVGRKMYSQIAKDRNIQDGSQINLELPDKGGKALSVGELAAMVLKRNGGRLSTMPASRPLPTTTPDKLPIGSAAAKPVEVTVKPKPAPTTKPATKPAEPVVEAPKKVYPKDPLVSPDELVEALAFAAPLPPSESAQWAKLDDKARKERQSKYERDLAAYKPKDDFRGKAVSWDLVLEKVEKSSPGRISVTATSGKGYAVTASVREKGNESLLLAKAGAAVRVSGAIQEYKLTLRAPGGEEMSGGATEEFGVLVQDAKVSVKPK